MCHLQTILKLLMTGRDHPRSGVMIPIPQYPLYTATIAEYNAYTVGSCNYSVIIVLPSDYFWYSTL